MKVERPSGSARAQRAATAYASAPAQAVTPVAGLEPVSAAIFGIPEVEFTPRVRDAIMTLMHEVDRLRRDVEQVQSRLADATRTADQDMLLPILNRRAFVREITRCIAFAERYGTPSSFLYFDLDNFKEVNDRYGHSAGDSVLKQFSEAILGQIRDTDILARLGGDEFRVILSHVTLDQASRKSESLQEEMRKNPPRWNGQKLDVGFSCGAFELRAGYTADTAIAEADQAMYQQKRGR